MITPLTLFLSTYSLESRSDAASFMVTKRASSQLLFFCMQIGIDPVNLE